MKDNENNYTFELSPFKKNSRKMNKLIKDAIEWQQHI